MSSDCWSLKGEISFLGIGCTYLFAHRLAEALNRLFFVSQCLPWRLFHCIVFRHAPQHSLSHVATHTVPYLSTHGLTSRFTPSHKRISTMGTTFQHHPTLPTAVSYPLDRSGYDKILFQPSGQSHEPSLSTQSHDPSSSTSRLSGRLSVIHKTPRRTPQSHLHLRLRARDKRRWQHKARRSHETTKQSPHHDLPKTPQRDARHVQSRLPKLPRPHLHRRYEHSHRQA
jgi:hypothetical protein